MFILTFTDGTTPRTHPLREGDTLIGRSPSCELVVNAPGISRQHARVRLAGGRAYLRDADSKYGTLLNSAPLAGEQELHHGDTFEIGHVTIAFTMEAAASELLSEGRKLIEDSGTIVRRVDQLGAAPAPAAATPAFGVSAATATAAVGGRVAGRGGAAVVDGSTPAPPGLPIPSTAPPAGRVAAPNSERRLGSERRKVNLGRSAGDRRSRRDRRSGRILRLLIEISKTLVTVQPLSQVLARVVDLVFDVLPAERAFLLLRDSMDQPLTPRVMRNRDGSAPANATLSHTVIHKVMRDRVAMLAKDALYDPRLEASASIHGMNIRSFMCAPLWNRNDVIGVLYCDNPLSKRFEPDDLEVFTALCNYAAVAIEQARLAQQLVEETSRRERLQRYHSPGVIRRILHSGGDSEAAFVAQERDVTIMFTDIVGFTRICENLEPGAVGDLLNSYFGRMAEIVFEHEGTLDKFIGDAILAVFGAPFDQPDHAARCVAAALAMRAELAKVNESRPDQPIQMRIAINSGRALTGDIGSPKRKEFTVLGDVVNTASRIEASVVQPDQIVISENTQQRLGGEFQLKSLGKVALRGRQSELEVFEVLG